MSGLTKFQFLVLEAIASTGFVGGRERANQPARRAAINAMRDKKWFEPKYADEGRAGVKLTDIGKALLRVERERRAKIAERDARRRRGGV